MKKTTKKIELKQSETRQVLVAEAIIRPTGLLDPIILVKPIANQVEDVLEEVRKRVLNGTRVLITTLTKKFAEELDLYFKQINIKSAYIHSEVQTLDRLDILSDLRRGRFDVLIGINLLREGLDLPEVSLVAIFDADKEGFLRSRTSLIQIIGRAARHSEGTVIMYADNVTKSMQLAIDETERRRTIQHEYNLKNNITPVSTKREMKTIAGDVREDIENDENYGKAGAVLTAQGFQEIIDPIDEFEITNNNKAEGKNKGKRPMFAGTNSVHGAYNDIKTSSRGKQVYDSFETQKINHIKELKSLKLSSTELQERLQIAVDALDFEMAAAIRDLMEK
jgi:excinuclease ABC subunit B